MSKMTAGDKFAMTTTLVYLIVILAALWGWISNILKLITMLGLHTPITDTLFIGRAIGIFAPPLGAILGYMW